MDHCFNIEFYNSVSHMAAMETDCSGLCQVKYSGRETMQLILFKCCSFICCIVKAIQIY